MIKQDPGLSSIIQSFGLDPEKFEITKLTTGHIHATYKLNGIKGYILQRVNKNVFTRPQVIADNIHYAADYLKKNHPRYLFLHALPAVDEKELSYDAEGFPWRLFSFIENTLTIDKVETEIEAYNAAAEFARLTAYLEGVDIDLFKPTIDRFHDLALRYEQFENAVANAIGERLERAKELIKKSQNYRTLVDQYSLLINSGALRLRITHNDTKINNILLDATTRQAVCVIDLDTLMPGYFIYDAGDMIRTFVSPVDEEEKDVSKIRFRKPIYDALVAGYLSQMGPFLTTEEKKLFGFSGMMMTYIMALRMLADYLNGDVYYHTTYPDQNFVRASNQLKLLDVLSENFRQEKP